MNIIIVSNLCYSMLDPLNRVENVKLNIKDLRKWTNSLSILACKWNGLLKYVR